jgi:hypothetical protein
MKKLMPFATVLLLLSFITAPGSITKKEREQAIKLLKSTQDNVLNEIKGLSEAQLKYKPAPDRWSVEECVKHIAVTEQALWKVTENGIKQPANPEKRSEIKATDEQLVQMVESREKKVKTSEQLKPENTPFTSVTDAAASFTTNRQQLIDYVKTTNEDLRNHVVTLPFGSADCYQMTLFIAAHSNRHARQIKEVKADPGFPKN